MGSRGGSSHGRGGGGPGGAGGRFAGVRAAFNAAYGMAHTNGIMRILEQAPGEIQDMWEEFGGRFRASRLRNDEAGAAYYSANTDSVHMNVADYRHGTSISEPYEVVFHEYGHMTDYLIARQMGYGRYTAYSEIYKGGALGRTAKDELEGHLKRIGKSYPELAGDRTALASILIREARQRYPSGRANGNLSDIMEGAGIGRSHPLSGGHGLDYWAGRDNGKEIFAEITSSLAANPGSLAAIQHYFPKTYKTYQNMIKERKKR